MDSSVPEMYGHPPGQEKLSPPRKVKKRLVDTEIDYPRARHPNLPKLRNRPAESFKRRQSIFASTPKRIIIEEGVKRMAFDHLTLGPL